jgi:short-subunit dehydrogenase involved in D-alanine esterification of teichoic acids
MNNNCLLWVFFFSGCRNPKEAQKSVEANINSELIKDRVFYEVTDTSDLELVRKFAETISIKYPAINLLINNGECFFNVNLLNVE